MTIRAQDVNQMIFIIFCRPDEKPDVSHLQMSTSSRCQPPDSRTKIRIGWTCMKTTSWTQDVDQISNFTFKFFNHHQMSTRFKNRFKTSHQKTNQRQRQIKDKDKLKTKTTANQRQQTHLTKKKTKKDKEKDKTKKKTIKDKDKEVESQTNVKIIKDKDKDV